MNKLHYGKKTHLKTVMAAYSNDTYEQVPFSCDPKLPDQDVKNRIHTALYWRFKPSHFGGCGYSCSMTEFHRTSPTGGHVVIMHYQGIGD
jgi:hypothetical protein